LKSERPTGLFAYHRNTVNSLITTKKVVIPRSAACFAHLSHRQAARLPRLLGSRHVFPRASFIVSKLDCLRIGLLLRFFMPLRLGYALEIALCKMAVVGLIVQPLDQPFDSPPGFPLLPPSCEVTKPRKFWDLGWYSVLAIDILLSEPCISNAGTVMN
jgi:hypothetical protein